MAMTHLRAMEVADEAKVLADDVGRVLAKVERFLTFNSNQAIDWGNESKPAFLTEDGDGNLDGRRFTRQQVSNVIGSLENVRKLLRNEAPSQGDHLGNFNQLAQPMPIR